MTKYTIFMPLLDEGIDVKRPVFAKKVGPNSYLILDIDYDPATETWAFPPGSVVKCEGIETSNGIQQIAVEKI